MAGPQEHSLDWVRQRIELLIYERRARALSPVELSEYTDLCEEEARLLAAEPGDE